MGPATRPFVDARVADLDRAGAAVAVAAEDWQLPEPTLLRLGMNALYAAGDVVLRVSTPSAPAELGLRLSDVLTERGLPVARPARRDVVRHDGLSVTAWVALVETGEPVDWRAVGGVVRRVHELAPDDLPEGYPLPSPADFPWWRFDSMLADVAPHLDDEAVEGVRAAIDRHRGWERFDATVVCHGDVHPGNVMMTEGGVVLLDWDLMCLAPRGWDHGPMMTWAERWGGVAGEYEAFADGYGWSARGDRGAEAFAELRLVAATLMRVKAGLVSPAAMPEAQRRLDHWRGRDDAAAWNAQ